MTRVVLVAGAGGVGKTTITGALGVAAAAAGAQTLVLTVDPARRLADALGLSGLTNDPLAVPGDLPLDAAMLDARAAWHSVAHHHTDPETAARLVESRFFRAIAERFPAGQAYAVAEETARLVDGGRYDVVVVDTPPVGGAVDFFTAPHRIERLVAGKALRLLTGPDVPGKRALFDRAGRPALAAADRILGSSLLADLAEFLLDLRTTYDGIRIQAAEVQRLIDEAGLVVVSTPSAGPLATVRRLLAARSATGVILNRVCPSAWAEAAAAPGSPWESLVAEWAAEARRHAAVAEELPGSVVTIPLQLDPPTSLDALSGIAATLGLAGLLPRLS